MQLRARACAQTSQRSEPGQAADTTDVSDTAQPVGAAEGWGLPARATVVTYLCPQADSKLPGPGRPDCPPESGEVAEGAAQPQVASFSVPVGGSHSINRGEGQYGSPWAHDPGHSLRPELCHLALELTVPICPREPLRHMEKLPRQGGAYAQGLRG